MTNNYFGIAGIKDDGDVYDDGNQLSFQKFVMKNTNNRGVHLVMADGVSKTISHCQGLTNLLLTYISTNDEQKFYYTKLILEFIIISVIS